MPLPILSNTSAELIRLYYRTELHWVRHLGEETQLDVGVALANPTLHRVYEANRLVDLALPDGMAPAEALSQIEAHYASINSRCWKITANPSAPPERTQPMIDHLHSAGWRDLTCDIMYLGRMPGGISIPRNDLTVIPARASYRHMTELFEEGAKRWNEPQLVDAELLHLDDPHFDALLAIKDGKAAGWVGVLAVGEVGRIEPLYVSANFRRQGIGLTLMLRALEICVRSQFRHVFLGTDASNAPAIALYSRLGFTRLAQVVDYAPPDSKLAPPPHPPAE